MTWSFNLVTIVSFSSHYQIISSYCSSKLEGTNSSCAQNSRRRIEMNQKNYVHLIYILVRILILTMFTHTFPILKLRLPSLSTPILPSSSLDFSKPLVVIGDGKSYPRNPTNSYVSKFIDDNFGCLDCGSDLHIFRE